MKPMSFPGACRDARGVEPLRWRLVSSLRPGWSGRFEVLARIRGVKVWGADFDGLEPLDPGQREDGVLPLNAAGEVGNCILSGSIPCRLDVAGEPTNADVDFELDLTSPDASLTLSCSLGGRTYAVKGDLFEDGLQRLEAVLPPEVRLVTCVTCLFSDYSPGGHGLTGMSCHRDAKEQYLDVRSKADYWSVPVTEDVPEFYLCPQYRRRVPGTGYRG